MPIPTKIGGEFFVNATRVGTQIKPSSISELRNGRFMVVFDDNSGTGADTSGVAVRAQIFDTDGGFVGDEFLVNTTTQSDQDHGDIGALADGSFVVVWRDNSQTAPDNSGNAVRGQRFDFNGTKLGSEFLVNGDTHNHQSAASVTGLTNGKFVVAYSSSAGSSRDIRAQLFNADGSKSGNEFVVNSTTDDSQEASVVRALPDGKFVVIFVDQSETGADTSESAIRGQLFDENGSALGSELLVNSSTDGRQELATVATLSDGKFVVTWWNEQPVQGDQHGHAVLAQMFNADGSKLGAEFIVNTTTKNEQTDPAIAALTDGRFVIAYTETSAGYSDVRAQTFNADGSKHGGEFIVNSSRKKNQQEPSIAVLPDGRFVITWHSNENDGGDVKGQIFDPRLTAIDLDGTAVADEFVGSEFNDKIDGKLGDDFLRGGNGDDILDGGKIEVVPAGLLPTSSPTDAGNDRLIGGGGRDTLLGRDGEDVLEGGKGADVLNGGEDNDTMNGGKGRDRLEISGSAGSTVDLAITARQNTGYGADVIKNIEDVSGGSGEDQLSGNKGENTLEGNEGNDILNGRNGNDELYGGDDDDTLFGGGKNDKLFGGADNDFLNGGSGKNIFAGGTGSDTFDFSSVKDIGKNKKDRDLISDWEDGLDEVDLSSIDAKKGDGNQAFQWIGDSKFNKTKGELRYVKSDGKTFVQGDTDGDGNADFKLQFDGQFDFEADDFIL